MKGYKWLLSQNQRVRIDFLSYRRYEALGKPIKPFLKIIKVKGRQCPDYNKNSDICVNKYSTYIEKSTIYLNHLQTSWWPIIFLYSQSKSYFQIAFQFTITSNSLFTSFLHANPLSLLIHFQQYIFLKMFIYFLIFYTHITKIVACCLRWMVENQQQVFKNLRAKKIIQMIIIIMIILIILMIIIIVVKIKTPDRIFPRTL